MVRVVLHETSLHLQTTTPLIIIIVKEEDEEILVCWQRNFQYEILKHCMDTFMLLFQVVSMVC